VREIVNEIRADLGLLGADSLTRHKRRTPPDLAVLWARAVGLGAGAGVAPMPRVDPRWRLGGVDDGTPRVRGGP
jgi:hypothetical protein